MRDVGDEGEIEPRASLRLPGEKVPIARLLEALAVMASEAAVPADARWPTPSAAAGIPLASCFFASSTGSRSSSVEEHIVGHLGRRGFRGRPRAFTPRGRSDVGHLRIRDPGGHIRGRLSASDGSRTH